MKILEELKSQQDCMIGPPPRSIPNFTAQEPGQLIMWHNLLTLASCL